MRPKRGHRGEGLAKLSADKWSDIFDLRLVEVHQEERQDDCDEPEPGSGNGSRVDEIQGQVSLFVHLLFAVFGVIVVGADYFLKGPKLDSHPEQFHPYSRDFFLKNRKNIFIVNH